MHVVLLVGEKKMRTDFEERAIAFCSNMTQEMIYTLITMIIKMIMIMRMITMIIIIIIIIVTEESGKVLTNQCLPSHMCRRRSIAVRERRHPYLCVYK